MAKEGSLRESLHILNSREKKHILKRIEDQWGASLPPAVLLQSNKQKVFLISQDLDKLDWQDFKVDKAGLYIGRFDDKESRLSIEGTQLIGPLAKKNVLEISEENVAAWFRGEDLVFDEEKLKGFSGFVILKDGKNKVDFLGSGRVLNNRILNFVPKGRRTENLIN